MDEAMAAGGPLTPDNPFAVAMAFWYAVLNENYDGLEIVITPESHGRWDLADLHQRTEDSGITTGVMKPCYDIAYVRLANDVGDEDRPLKVAGGLIPLNRGLSASCTGQSLAGRGDPI